MNNVYNKQLNIIKCSFLIILVSLQSFLYGQIKISGIVESTNKKIISQAIVYLKSFPKDSLIDYKITNSKGEFDFANNYSGSKLILLVKHISYKSYQDTLSSSIQTISIKLEESIEVLKEFKLQSTQPIILRNDTVVYNIEPFAKKNDFSIGDVLKRIPGIEINANGRISYQGKPINKYYIEGMDLMDGRYGLINENLAFKKVKQVEILEHHQPIKILDKIIPSQSPALNLKLQNKITVTTTAKLGLGLSPLIWDLNLTPIFLNPKLQFIASFQANNTGENILKQNQSFNFEDIIEIVKNQNITEPWLNIQPLNNPNFASTRWWNNNTLYGSINLLKTLKKELSFRINASYYEHQQIQNGFNKTHIYVVDDTIQINEDLRNEYITKEFQLTATLDKNTSKVYINNKFEFNNYSNNQIGLNAAFQNNLNQEVTKQLFKLNNNFKLIKNINNNIIRFSNNLIFNDFPANLTVYSQQTLFNPIFQLTNNQNQQQYLLKSLQTKSLLEYIINKPTVKISQSIQINTFYQKLNTNWNVDTLILNQLNVNNMDYYKTIYSYHAAFHINNKRFKASFENPLSVYEIQIFNKIFNNTQKQQFIAFEPQYFLNYTPHNLWEITNNASWHYEFGDLNQVYSGYILNTYRIIQQADNLLPFNQVGNFNIGLNYKNPFKAFFTYLQYSFTFKNKNLISNSNTYNNGVNLINYLVQNNNEQSQSFSFSINKKIRPLNTSLKLQTKYTLNQSNAILNQQYVTLLNQIFNVNFNQVIDISKWYYMECSESWNFIQNKNNNTNYPNVEYWQANVKNYFFPNDNIFISLFFDYYKNNILNNKDQYLFIDFDIKYKFNNKRKIELELLYSNITNIKYFQTAALTNNIYFESNFQLRPTQVIFKVNFNF